MTPNQKSLYELLKSYYEHKTGKLIPVNVEGDELKEAVSKAEEESRRIKYVCFEFSIQGLFYLRLETITDLIFLFKKRL